MSVCESCAISPRASRPPRTLFFRPQLDEGWNRCDRYFVHPHIPSYQRCRPDSQGTVHRSGRWPISRVNAKPSPAHLDCVPTCFLSSLSSQWTCTSMRHRIFRRWARQSARRRCVRLGLPRLRCSPLVFGHPLLCHRLHFWRRCPLVVLPPRCCYQTLSDRAIAPTWARKRDIRHHCP